MIAHTILYVKDQALATAFYETVLAMKPNLNVPGMTEFHISSHFILGLMPEKGIKRLLEKIPDPATASGIPRAELYWKVPDPEIFHQRALRAGARELSPLLNRDWGDVAAYSLDLDGHVLAFARAI